MANVDSFRAASSKGGSLALSDFEGKVPVVILFLGPIADASGDLRAFDRHLVDFGRHRVQLLCVVRGDGNDVRSVPFEGLNLPVLADPHGEIEHRFGGHFAVILDRQGDLVAQVPSPEGPEQIISRIESLGLAA